MSALRPLPRYRCHKEVWALKIGALSPPAPPAFTTLVCRGSFELGTACGHCERCAWVRAYGPHPCAWLVPADPLYAPFPLDPAYVAKHQPQVGGYYVVYQDGYTSYSPASAFEEGYTLIPDGDVRA